MSEEQILCVNLDNIFFNTHIYSALLYFEISKSSVNFKILKVDYILSVNTNVLLFGVMRHMIRLRGVELMVRAIG